MDIKPASFYPKPKITVPYYYSIQKNFIQINDPNNLEKIKGFFNQRRKC